MTDKEYYDALWRQGRMTGCLLSLAAGFAAVHLLCLVNFLMK